MASNQMQILQALIEADDPEAIPILIDCLGSSHHATVRFAAESIGTMAKKQKDICNMAVSELVDALASENAQIRKSVLNTLLLLDIPLCYSSAISNVVRGDNQPYNKTLAKKIIQNIISNDSSFKYDNYSEPSSTFKQGVEVHKVDHDSASKTVEPHIRFDQGVIKNVSAAMPDIDAEFYDFRDFIKSDYPSKDSLTNSSGDSSPSCEVTVLVDNKESVETVFNVDQDGDCFDEKERLISSLSFEELLALDRPAEYISEELWKTWCKSIEKTPMASAKVIKVAKKHNLFWENRFIRFSRYLNYSLHDIKNFYGFNAKKIRTLILCVASLNISPSPPEDTPLPDVQLIDEKKLSSPDEHLVLTTKPLEVHAANNQDCADNSDGVTRVFDYEFSNKLVIDDHYNEIMQSHDPEEFIPAAIYDKWRVSLADTIYANQNMRELAAEINLWWPTTRYDEKLSDYLGYDISSIRTIPTFGRKKIRTLILCVTHAAYKYDRIEFAKDNINNNDQNATQQSSLTFEELLDSEKPYKEISIDLWESWCESINKSPSASLPLAEIAYRIGLDWTYTKRDECVSKYSTLSLREIRCLPGLGKKKIKTLILCIASLILIPQPVDVSHDSDDYQENEFTYSKINIDEINSLIRKELVTLSEREQIITSGRYGIGDKHPSTLEEIAVDLGITRERVRQLLKVVVEKLKISSIGKLLPRMISRLDADEFWERVSNQYNIIFKSDVNRAFERQIHGEFILALDCCEMSVTKWLSSIAHEGAHAWYRASLTQYELGILMQEFEGLIQQTDLPLPLATISQHLGISEQDAGMLICISSEYVIFDRYVLKGRIGPRARRTVHLHQLLNSEGSFLTLHDLTERHNSEYSNERCSTRDADIVMREAPHLFVLLGDKGWCSIGCYKADWECSEEQAAISIDPEQQIDLIEAAADEINNVTSIIVAILRNRGLSNFMDIVNEFKEITGASYSEHSVGPMLYTRDAFVKFAPSIYGLREHLQGFGQNTSDLLLNEADCQLFTMARYAGEDFGSFPLWSPAMEYKWCQWAEQNVNDELRGALYYIASPDDWPIYDKLIKEWKYKAAQCSYTYCFLREPKYGESNLPDIRSIYSLIRYAKDNGSISWISANRVLGRRIDDYHTAIDIAFLVCFGIVEPAENWQKLHHVKEEAEDIECKLSMMLHCGQGASWKSPAGDLLLDTFTIGINSFDMGWVDVSEVNKLFHNAAKQSANLISEANLSIQESLPESNSASEYVRYQEENYSSDYNDNAGELFLLLDDDDTIILS